eukprot:TRINITY_DN28469_c0_g1_i1.p1 TRINITY_DN28469_c0_g1~~TRINITY_DN28469_c0_g1_i1.p1  ORF type:complete len:818 (+),score=160.08 TRINITY_DN28469_c0_g1_i1:210-2663(+)
MPQDQILFRFQGFIHFAPNLSEAAFQASLENDRELLKYVDEAGCTVLHQAIVKRYGANKIAVLLALRPELVKVRHKGQLPLHLYLDEALRPEDVSAMEKIFDAYPKAACELDKFGAVPTFALHKILLKQPFASGLLALMQRCLRVFPEAVDYSFEGNRPLHLALDGSKTAEAMLAVLEADKGNASVRAADGILPLHAAVLRQLDTTVVTALLEAYPQALLDRVQYHEEHQNIVEVALRQNLGQDLVLLLVSGGTGTDPAAVECSRAAILGAQNKKFLERAKWQKVEKAEKAAAAARLHLDMGVEEKNAWRRQARFKIQTEDGPIEDIILPSDATLDDLKEWVLEKEGIPIDLQLIELNDHRVAEGLPISDFVQDRNTILKVSYENHLMQLALKRMPASEPTVMKLLEVRPRFAMEADEVGKLPLHIALEAGGSEQVLMQLFDIHPGAAGVITSGPMADFALNIAIRHNAPEKVLRALMRDVTAEDFTESGHFISRNHQQHKVQDGDTITASPLLASAVESAVSVEIIRLVLEKKSPVNVRCSKTGHTPLECALVCDSHPDIIKELLVATAKADELFNLRQGSGGQTLMHTACHYGTRASTIRLILEYGTTSLMLPDDTGKLPIHLAVSSGMSYDAVRELVATCPRSLEEVDHRGRTPLQVAVISAPPAGVVCELTRWAKDLTTIQDGRGRSLLNIASFVDAPITVVHELLDACPKLLEEVSLLDGKWPPTNAGKEVLRIALLNQRDQRKQAAMQPAASVEEAPIAAPAVARSACLGPGQRQPADVDTAGSSADYRDSSAFGQLYSGLGLHHVFGALS